MQKVIIASIHLDGVASLWYRSEQAGKPLMSWNEFLSEISVRFSPLPHENVLWEFKELRQTGFVQQYKEIFEKLKGVMQLRNGNWTKQDHVDHYVGGLKEEIRNMVQTSFPTDLSLAYSLSKLHESTVGIRNKVISTTNKTYPRTTSLPQPTSFPNSFSNSNFHNQQTASSKFPIPTQSITKSNPQSYRSYTRSEAQGRRMKGLCYKCDEKYTLGHKCPNKQVYALIGGEE